MSFKKTFWKYTTVLIVFILMLNPTLMPLGVFIDAIGLDMLLLVAELQFVAVYGYYFQTWCKPVLKPIYSFIQKVDPYFFLPTKVSIQKCPAILCHAIPGFMVLSLGLVATISDTSVV